MATSSDVETGCARHAVHAAVWPIAVGAQTNPAWGRGWSLLESLHTGPVQPCYATGNECTNDISVSAKYIGNNVFLKQIMQIKTLVQIYPYTSKGETKKIKSYYCISTISWFHAENLLET